MSSSSARRRRSLISQISSRRAWSGALGSSGAPFRRISPARGSPLKWTREISFEGQSRCGNSHSRVCRIPIPGTVFPRTRPVPSAHLRRVQSFPNAAPPPMLMSRAPPGRSCHNSCPFPRTPKAARLRFYGRNPRPAFGRGRPVENKLAGTIPRNQPESGFRGAQPQSDRHREYDITFPPVRSAHVAKSRPTYRRAGAPVTSLPPVRPSLNEYEGAGRQDQLCPFAAPSRRSAKRKVGGGIDWLSHSSIRARVGASAVLSTGRSRQYEVVWPSPFKARSPFLDSRRSGPSLRSSAGCRV